MGPDRRSGGAAGPDSFGVGEDSLGAVDPLAGWLLAAGLGCRDLPSAFDGGQGVLRDALPLREDVQQLVRGRPVDLAEETLGEGRIAEGVTDGLDGPRLAAHRCLRNVNGLKFRLARFRDCEPRIVVRDGLHGNSQPGSLPRRAPR
ncbi:ABATE domain-containing protein [Streptomyces sp. NPDC005122]